RILKLDVDWVDTRFLKKNVVVDSELKQNLIKHGIKYVYISDDYSNYIPNIKDLESVSFKTVYDNPKIYLHSVAVVKAVFNEILEKKTVNLDAIYKAADKVVETTTKDYRPLVYLTKLHTYSEYLYHHSVNVSIYSTAVGKLMGMNARELRMLTIGGLVHDIGKLFIPSEILNKKGTLTQDEFTVVKKHPLLGAELLKRLKVDEPILKVVLEHHERNDGSGYPKGLKADKISIFGKIGAVCDVFDAITSDRVYKSAKNPNEAIREMNSEVGKLLDKTVFEYLVTNIGLFPVGTLVLLNTKEVGVVCGQNKNPSEPILIVFLRSDGKKIPPMLVDLSKKSFAKRKIVKALDYPISKIPKSVINMIDKMYETVS
ncbi:MAG: HD-GYP domain-containing protein, partial [Deferribacterota bacterium]|nr:HD-GYP domain-containing protein [Deferribacterota bacterium]